jgi:DNA-binding CsgD family transcriptional regulator
VSHSHVRRTGDPSASGHWNTSWERMVDALGVTERTVSAHLENAYRKLGVKTRVAAIDIARRAGQLP